MRYALVAILVLPFAPLNVFGEQARPAAEAASAETLKLPDGFRAERLYSVPADKEGSWVSLAVDARGRIIAGDQYGGLYRMTPPIGTGGKAQIESLAVEIGGAHGLLWVFESLYVVVNEAYKGKPAGLYRLRDTNADDQFDEVTLLRAIQGSGEHGPHAVVLGPDGKSLYLVAGNFTRLPNPETSTVPRVWGEDQLLPRMPDAGGHDPHILAPAGWIARTDADGAKWEVVSVGFRNAFDIAFNRDGELFTYDSDMEWDIGAPWYRPTRLCHAVDGAEFGFRNGSGKWPPYYPDNLPAVVDIGPGSPTGLRFGYGAKFPARYQDALYMLDWSYGIIYAAHLAPRGASYTATFEKFITGAPLPVTDMVIGADGAMYFAVGGRRTQSGLYRVTYVGAESTAPSKPVADPAAADARRLRHELESLYVQRGAAVVDKAWPHLAHADRFIRFAARTAIEHQPVTDWQARALAETNPQAAITALVALARCADKSAQPQLLAALDRIDWQSLERPQRLELLRVYALAFTRGGKPPVEMAATVAQRLDGWFPAESYALNRELSTLLVYLGSPTAVAKSLDLLAKAPTQEEQIHYALALRRATAGWTAPLRGKYFGWFERAAAFRGGHSFAGFIRNIRREAVAALSAEERAALGPLLADYRPIRKADLPSRPHVKNYTLDELVPLVQESPSKRSFDNGRKMFAAAMCANCHRFGDEGGIGGPDLTSLAGRFSARDLLEATVDPNKVISDQYQSMTFVLEDGRQVTGRIVNQSGEGIHVVANLLEPDDIVKINSRSIEEIVPSKVSPMPEGLLNTLSREEIMDLFAYLLSRGDKNHAAFK